MPQRGIFRCIRRSAFYYDNRGDPTAYDHFLQWGWRTRFGQLAAQLAPGKRTLVTAQALTGTTQMGFPLNGRPWADTGFRSAFLLVTRHLDERSSVSARVEAFATRGHGGVEGPATGQDGWAATIAGRHRIVDHPTLLAEWLHVRSDRAARIDAGETPRQAQNVGHVSLRAEL